MALEIVESYRNFKPPPNFRKILDDLLRVVPSEHLVGLKSIILANSSALTRDQRKQKVWSRNRKVRLAEARGAYYRATHSSPATIWLYVDNIVRSEPRHFWRLPLLRYVPLSDVLYHEIGHHIHAAHKPVYEGKEDVAESWRRKLTGRFMRRHYWYLLPILHPLSHLATLVARRSKNS